MRQLIVNVKRFFDTNRNNPQIFQTAASTLAGSALGVSECTVKTVMALFNNEGTDGLAYSRINHRGRPSFGLCSPFRSIFLGNSSLLSAQ